MDILVIGYFVIGILVALIDLSSTDRGPLAIMWAIVIAVFWPIMLFTRHPSRWG